MTALLAKAAGVALASHPLLYAGKTWLLSQMVCETKQGYGGYAQVRNWVSHGADSCVERVHTYNSAA
jgi:hypothetical protein